MVLLQGSDHHNVSRQVEPHQREVTLPGLHGYINYSVTVMAINSATEDNGYSDDSSPVFALTDIRGIIVCPFNAVVTIYLKIH